MKTRRRGSGDLSMLQKPFAAEELAAARLAGHSVTVMVMLPCVISMASLANARNV